MSPDERTARSLTQSDRLARRLRAKLPEGQRESFDHARRSGYDPQAAYEYAETQTPEPPIQRGTLTQLQREIEALPETDDTWDALQRDIEEIDEDASLTDPTLLDADISRIPEAAKPYVDEDAIIIEDPGNLEAQFQPGMHAYQRFEDGTLLGKGSEGEVRRLRRRGTGGSVAAKRLKADLGTPEGRASMLNEARLVERLGKRSPRNSPVRFIAAHIDDGDGHIVYEDIAKAVTLKEILIGRLKDHRQFPVARKVELVRDTAYAVASDVHGRGVVHRDLKPENILIEQTGGPGTERPRLLDFGLARELLEDQVVTEFGMTPSYSAPEQARIKPEATMISDVYAAGLMLVDALTGKKTRQMKMVKTDAGIQAYHLVVSHSVPVRAGLRRRPKIVPNEDIEFLGVESLAEALDAFSEHLTENDAYIEIPDEADGLTKQQSKALFRVAKKALANDPRNRYQSMEAFADAIDAALKVGEQGGKPYDGTTLLGRMRNWVHDHPIVSGVLSALGIGGATTSIANDISAYNAAHSIAVQEAAASQVGEARLETSQVRKQARVAKAAAEKAKRELEEERRLAATEEAERIAEQERLEEERREQEIAHAEKLRVAEEASAARLAEAQRLEDAVRLQTEANARFTRGDYEGARASATSALEQNDQLSDAYFVRADSNLRLGDREAAIQDFEAAADLASRVENAAVYETARARQAILHVQNGEYEQAEAAFRDLIENAEEGTTLSNLARSFVAFAEDDFLYARDLAEKENKPGSQDPWAHTLLAHLFGGTALGTNPHADVDEEWNLRFESARGVFETGDGLADLALYQAYNHSIRARQQWAQDPSAQLANALVAAEYSGGLFGANNRASVMSSLQATTGLLSRGVLDAEQTQAAIAAQAQARLTQARVFGETQHYQTARALIDQARETYGDELSSRLHLVSARVHVANAEYGLAQADSRKDKRAARKAAETAYGQAEQDVRASLEQRETAEGQLELYRVLTRTKDKSGAKAALERARELSPAWGVQDLVEGEELERAGKYSTAIKKYATARETNPALTNISRFLEGRAYAARIQGSRGSTRAEYKQRAAEHLNWYVSVEQHNKPTIEQARELMAKHKLD